jgi:hypothetical protein
MRHLLSAGWSYPTGTRARRHRDPSGCARPT